LDVAMIVDVAGHGIDLDHWMAVRDGDNSVFAAARRLVIEDRTSEYHYSRAYVLELDGRVAGGLVGGLVSAGGRPGDGLPPHLKPLIALENRIGGSWNMLAVAVYPEFRGKGLASELLDHAAQLASKSGAPRLSVVVEDSNARAVALYTR